MFIGPGLLTRLGGQYPVLSREPGPSTLPSSTSVGGTCNALMSPLGPSESEPEFADLGQSGACSILDGQLYDELDLDEDFLDDEGMDDMFSVDLNESASAGLEALVSSVRLEALVCV